MNMSYPHLCLQLLVFHGLTHEFIYLPGDREHNKHLRKWLGLCL